MSRLPSVWLCCLVPLLAISGCAEHQASTRVTTSPRTVTISDGTVARPDESRSPVERRGSAKRPAREVTSAPLPDRTGVPACDDYLSSYIACHRAANIFPADQLQTRYEMMRTTLLRDSLDPKTRTFQADRCNALAAALRDALHGKSCDAAPATANSSP